MIAREAEQFASQLPELYSETRMMPERFAGPYAEQLGLTAQGGVEERIADLIGGPGTAAGDFVRFGPQLLDWLLLLFLTSVLTFYLLRDWPRVADTFDDLVPRQSAPVVMELLSRMRDQFIGFVRGQGLLCLGQAVIHATGLALIGLNYGLLIGILTGLAAAIPVVGSSWSR